MYLTRIDICCLHAVSLPNSTGSYVWKIHVYLRGKEQIKTKQCINDKGNWIFQGGRTDKYLHAI